MSHSLRTALYGVGISREGDLLDLGSEMSILEKSGSWYSFAGERLGQGRETARTFLKEHAEVTQKIDAALRKKIGLPEANKPLAAAAKTS